MVGRSRRRFSSLALFAIALAAASSSACDGVVRAQGAAQGDIGAIRTRVLQRFQLLPLHDGVALVPRFKTSTRSIDVSAGVIAVDGIEMTGRELRRALGPDADLVLQLSYLNPASRAALLGTAAPPPSREPASAPHRRPELHI